LELSRAAALSKFAEAVAHGHYLTALADAPHAELNQVEASLGLALALVHLVGVNIESDLDAVAQGLILLGRLHQINLLLQRPHRSLLDHTLQPVLARVVLFVSSGSPCVHARESLHFDVVSGRTEEEVALMRDYALDLALLEAVLARIEDVMDLGVRVLVLYHSVLGTLDALRF